MEASRPRATQRPAPPRPAGWTPERAQPHRPQPAPRALGDRPAPDRPASPAAPPLLTAHGGGWAAHRARRLGAVSSRSPGLPVSRLGLCAAADAVWRLRADSASGHVARVRLASPRPLGRALGASADVLRVAGPPLALLCACGAETPSLGSPRQLGPFLCEHVSELGVERVWFP